MSRLDIRYVVSEIDLRRANSSKMAGIIAGYEYDILISYRQIDNKYDGWVTVGRVIL
jgi:hypothetical protein